MFYLGDLQVGKSGLVVSRFTLQLGSCCLTALQHPPVFFLPVSSLSLFSPSSLLRMCLLLPSGREPSISSDTRTDSSTESYPYKHCHHESVVSHFSSDSQGTVICNVENDSMSQSSRDTGRDRCSGPCLPDSVCAQGDLPRKRNWGQSRNVAIQH